MRKSAFWKALMVGAMLFAAPCAFEQNAIAQGTANSETNSNSSGGGAVTNENTEAAAESGATTNDAGGGTSSGASDTTQGLQVSTSIALMFGVAVLVVGVFLFLAMQMRRRGTNGKANLDTR